MPDPSETTTGAVRQLGRYQRRWYPYVRLPAATWRNWAALTVLWAGVLAAAATGIALFGDWIAP